ESGKVLEAARLKQRTMYDIEMLSEMGYCSGIENYSRHMDRRAPGQTPWTLLDYFPDDFVIFVDESHISLPQVRGMYSGDRSRKTTLVDYGFRLPSALDNRPLRIDEFEQHIRTAVFVSATPGPYEMQVSSQVVEQIIRPTGLIDPVIHVRPTRGQVDDLIGEVRKRVEKGHRCLVTTLTKRMAEDLADYLRESGVRTHYLHSDIDVIERVEILRDLRLGVYDVVVGINLLREGLDLPEVSLVAILDADKEGYLRSASSLIQIIGRAARHVEGTVLMYADRMTASMEAAIRETDRRRSIQETYNREHNIVPIGINKSVRDLSDRLRKAAEDQGVYATTATHQTVELPASREAIIKLIKDLEKQMKNASRDLEFEKAAALRDQILDLRRTMALEEELAPSPTPQRPKDRPKAGARRR
ncbi:MAG: helicase-related protein, partial [Ilumatobacteraceae bacterium]